MHREDVQNKVKGAGGEESFISLLPNPKRLSQSRRLQLW